MIITRYVNRSGFRQLDYKPLGIHSLTKGNFCCPIFPYIINTDSDGWQERNLHKLSEQLV